MNGEILNEIDTVIWLAVEIAIFLFLFLYFLFSAVVIKQVDLMHDTISLEFDKKIKRLAKLLMFIAFLTLCVSLIVLII